MCSAWPLNEHSPWKLRLRDISEMAKQNSARNNVKCSKCFSFLCNNSDRTWFFNALTFARSLRRCWKPRPSASVFNTSHGTWRILMHEKPCLIPIINVSTYHLLVSVNYFSSHVYSLYPGTGTLCPSRNFHFHTLSLLPCSPWHLSATSKINHNLFITLLLGSIA